MKSTIFTTFVEHTPMSDDLTDDDFTTLATASFRALNEEEAQRAGAW